MPVELKAVPGSQPNGAIEFNSAQFNLDRISRLTTSSEFSYVFADASAIHTQSFTILARSSQQTMSRIGLVISKKNVARAVARNQLKRVIRESFRTHRELLPKVDIIVLAKKGADKKKNQELFGDLLKGWQKLARITT